MGDSPQSQSIRISYRSLLGNERRCFFSATSRANRVEIATKARSVKAAKHQSVNDGFPPYARRGLFNAELHSYRRAAPRQCIAKSSVDISSEAFEPCLRKFRRSLAAPRPDNFGGIHRRGAACPREVDMSDFSTSAQANISRRALLRGAAGALSVPVFAISVNAAMAKSAQSAVAYETTPKNGHSCGICMNFEPPTSCKLVDGTISPTGWCKLWTEKKA